MSDVEFIDAFDGDDSENRCYTLLPEAEGENPRIIGRALDTSDDGVTTYEASNDLEDRYGTFFEQTWRLRAWRANPIILAEHSTMHPIVGRGVRGSGVRTLDEGRRRLEIAVQWDDDEDNPLGRLIASQVRRGYRNGFSIRALPGKVINRRDLPEDDPRRQGEDVPRWRAGLVFKSPELLEGSSVALPGNAKALKLRAYGQEVDDPDEQVRRVADELVTRRTRDLVLDAVRKDAELRTAIRALLLDEPPAPATQPRAPASWLDTI